MKRKLLIIVLSIISVIACVFALSACTVNPTPPDNNPPDNPKPSATQYTVTYDANGGAFTDGSITLERKADEGTILTAPVSPSRANYSFGGWATDKGGKTLWRFASDTVSKNITLYAVWEEQSAVIFSAEGATIDEDKMSLFMLVDRNTESVSLSNKIVCSSDSVWKLYYDKLGQTEIPTKIASGKLGELSSGDNIFYIVVTSSNSAQVNVYELTVHRSYSVPISYYDSKENLIKTDTAYTGDEYKLNYKPAIAGYTFNGWNDSDGIAVTEVTLYEEASFYADCTAKNYTATLNVNGGDELEKAEYTATYDKALNLAVPTRTGYSFNGWFDGNTQITDAEGASLENWTYANDKSLTAKWTANSYNVNLRIGAVVGGTVTGSGSREYDSNVTINAQTNGGYTWLGWYDKDGGLVSNQTSYTFKMGFEVTFTAKWIVCPVTVQVGDAAAGMVTGVPLTTVAGQKVTATAISNLGYGFLGWYNGEEKLTEEPDYEFDIPSSDETEYTYTAKWEVDERLKNFRFTSTSYTCTLTYMINKDVEELIIPDYVTAIGDEACSGGSFESLTVPDSVTSIGKGAFSRCYHLENATVPAIALSEMTTSYLKNLVITKGATGDKALSGLTELESVTFLDGATSIGMLAFENCYRLKSVTIADSVTKIGDSAFKGCTRLESMTVPFVGNTPKKPNETYQYPLGNFFGTEKYTGSYEVSQRYYGSSTSSTTSKVYYIPESLKSVTVTGEYILYGAFRGCSSLENVTLGSAVKSIGGNAFYDCAGLTSITIPAGVTSVEGKVFDRCYALTVYCEAESKPLGWVDWWNTGDYGFECLAVWDCKNNDKDADGYAYTVVDGIRYRLKDGVAEVIRQSIALSGEVEILSVINYHGSEYAVTSVLCGSGTWDGAFCRCKKLTGIIIPAGITTFEAKAFYECDGNTKIYCKAESKPEGWDEDWNTYTQYGQSGVHLQTVWGYVPESED